MANQTVQFYRPLPDGTYEPVGEPQPAGLLHCATCYDVIKDPDADGYDLMPCSCTPDRP